MLWIFFVFLVVLLLVFMRPRIGRKADARAIHFADTRQERIYDKATGNILEEVIVDANNDRAG
jgi:hypothetical protein